MHSTAWVKTSSYNKWEDARGNLIDDPIPDKFLMISDDIDDPIVEIMSEIGQLTNN